MGRTNFNSSLDSLRITDPRPVHGGSAFFSELSLNGEAIKLQLPECSTRAGLRESSIQCEYSKDTELKMMQWFERLQAIILEEIIRHKQLWFAEMFSDEDIQERFRPIVKVWGESETSTIDVLVPKRDGKIRLPVYNDERVLIDSDQDIFDRPNRLIVLVSLSGIKFTADTISLVAQATQVMWLGEDCEGQVCEIEHGETATDEPITVASEAASEAASDPASEAANDPAAQQPTVDTVVAEQQTEAEPARSSSPVPSATNSDPDSFSSPRGEISLTSRAEVYRRHYIETMEKAIESRREAVDRFLAAEGIKNRLAESASSEEDVLRFLNGT